MKTAFLLASLALSSFALCGWSLAQDNSQPPDNNQPPAQSASLEDQVAQLERQQQVMQWQLDDLRNRGYMSADDPKIIEWKRSNLPNLMTSDVGKWMLDSNLMEYYS